MAKLMDYTEDTRFDTGDILIKDGAGQAEPRKQVTLAGATIACDVYSWGIKRRSLALVNKNWTRKLKK